MRRRTAIWLLGAGGAAAVAGGIVAFVFLLQPWRSCPYDDVPAGCVALPFDAAVMTIAMIVALLGFIVAVAGIVGLGSSGSGAAGR